MTTLECLKLLALMASPMFAALAAWVVWDKIEEKMEKRKR